MESRVSVRINDELKNEVQVILDEMGLDMSTAVTILFKEIRRTHEFPFKPSAKSGLEEAVEDIKDERVTTYDSLDDWKEAMMNL